MGVLEVDPQYHPSHRHHTRVSIQRKQKELLCGGKKEDVQHR